VVDFLKFPTGVFIKKLKNLDNATFLKREGKIIKLNLKNNFKKINTKKVYGA
jgi:hypothetical protein